MDYILETTGLKKSFKGTVAVNDVSIHVPKGSIYGFVGAKWSRKKHHYENDPGSDPA